jgi:molybdate transport system ATP-binding protein
LYVSHAIEEVARLADHMLILDAGRVYRQGLLSDVLAQLDEASLLADEQSVVLTGHFRQRDARWQLVLFVFDGGGLWVRDSGQALNQRGRVRILAKDVSLSRAHVNDSSILNRLAVRIDSIDNGADNGMARIGLSTANTRLVAHITQRSGAELELAVGQQLWAQIKSVAILG